MEIPTLAFECFQLEFKWFKISRGSYGDPVLDGVEGFSARDEI